MFINIYKYVNKPLFFGSWIVALAIILTTISLKPQGTLAIVLNALSFVCLVVFAFQVLKAIRATRDVGSGTHRSETRTEQEGRDYEVNSQPSTRDNS